MKKLNPKLIGILVVIAVILCFIGIKATASGKDKEKLERAEVAIEDGDFDSAESELAQAYGGKAEKLHKALQDYNSITTYFFNNYQVPVATDAINAGYKTGFEETYEVLKDLPSIYKKYPAFKSEVNEWKDKLKTAIDMEKDLRKEYKKTKKMLEDEKYDECIKKSEEWNSQIEKEFPFDEKDDSANYNETFSQRLKAFTFMFSEIAILNDSILNPDSNSYKPKKSDNSTKEPAEYGDDTVITQEPGEFGDDSTVTPEN